MIRIRRARRTDAAAIGRVHVETWQAAYVGLLPDTMLAELSDVRQSAYWSRALADPAEARGIFVAEDDDRDIVGFGSCGPARQRLAPLADHQRVGEVYTLYVEPDFQNLGLGRRLLDAMFRQMHADGCSAAMLWMLARNPTRFFYEGMGGVLAASRREPFAGTTVDEVAYAWRDLEAPLIRRRLAPDNLSS